MNISNRHYLIVDVEATCSDRGEVPRREMEIIEIGAVAQNARTFEVASAFQSFVRPVRHPKLTKFCQELTTISPADVAAAPLFPAAIQAFKNWLARFDDLLFCSWGDYDRGQFEQDCAYHRIAYPFAAAHLNLKAEFSRTMGLTKKLGMSAALRHLGLKLEGTHHRGIADAKNMARIVRRLCFSA